MSTRSVVNFCYNEHIEAKVYRHRDGYPETVLEDLARFFTSVKEQTADTRFHDPSYLAAKFVVWQAHEYADDLEKPLAFLGVGILMVNPGDIEYEYFINCNKRDKNSLPVVRYVHV